MNATELRLAAAVICARPHADKGFEILMGRQHEGAGFAGGFHVFPGGKIEDEDIDAATFSEDPRAPEPMAPNATIPKAAIQTAAGRELHEETGIQYAAERLRFWVNWVTPKPLPRRYDTYFYIAELEEQVARGSGELADFVWWHPTEALAAHKDGQAKLMFPTVHSLKVLEPIATYADLMKYLEATAGLRIEPEVQEIDGKKRPVLPAHWPPQYEMPR